MYKLIKVLDKLSLILGVIGLVLLCIFIISVFGVSNDKEIANFGGISLIGFFIFSILAIILDYVCIKLENKVKK